MAPPIAPTRCTACGGCPIALSRMLPTAGLLLVVLAVASCSAPTGLHGTASPRPSSPTAMHAPPYRPMVSITQAWGPHAATDTFSTQLDATHYMPNFGLAPDGHSLDGYMLTQVPSARIASTPAEAGILDIASHQFTPLGVASLPKCFGSSCQDAGAASYFLNCCKSDGRFLIAQSTGYPGPDCGGCLYSYDQDTGALYEVIPANQYQGVSTYLLDRGVLVAGTGAGIVIANLAGHTQRLTGTTGNTQLDAFSWPYVVYGTPGGRQGTTTTTSPLEVYDVTTGATNALPQVTGSILALADDILYYVATPDNRPPGAATLYELYDLTVPGAQPRVLASLPSVSGTGLPQSLGITGGILFYTVRIGLPQGSGCLPGFGVVCPTPAPVPPPVTMLYEVDHLLSGTPSVHAIAAYAADLGDVTMANDRLVALTGAVWDRAEGRFVSLGTIGGLGGSTHPSQQDATGNFLLIAHSLMQDWQSPFQVSIYDTTRLPVLAN